MNDSQFDDFVNDRLNEYAAPVPAGLWEKVAEGQFDQFIGNKLRDHTAAIPDGLWEKIADHGFDHFVAGKVGGNEAPVPAGMWEKIADGQFDSFVSDKIENYEAPVPEGVWEKIRPEEEDKDRVAFWWFRYPAAAVLLLALLTAGVWAGYNYLTQKNTVELVQAPIPAAKAPGDASVTTLSAAGQPGITQPPSLSPSGDHDRDTQAQPSGNSADEGAGINSNSSATNAVATDNGNKSSLTHSSGQNTSVNPDTQSPSAPLQGTGVLAQNASRDNTAAGGDHRLAPPPKNNTGSVNDPYNPFGKAGGVSASTGQGEDNTAYELNVFVPPYQPGYTEQSTVSQTRYSLKDLSDKQFTGANRKFKSVIICPADKDRTGWYLEPYVSADLAFKSVSNVSASSLYMLKKDSAERSRVGYSAGIRLVKPINENILLKAGLQFTQANEKYVYRTENEVKTTTVVTVRTIIRAPGDTVIVNDTSVLQTAGFRTNSVNNRIRSIDVPVTIGYQFGDDDLRFGINAGVVFNLTTWYHGTTLDTSLANVPLMNSGNGIYKTNLGLGLTGSISIVKKLSEGLHAFAEPYFRYNLSDMSTSVAGFKQRLSLGGLAVGLRINLNRY